MKPMFEITVVGEYVRGGRGTTVKKDFEEKFQLPLKDGEALSEIHNKLLKQRLKKADIEFKHVRKCRIVQQRPLDKAKALLAKDLGKMSADELIQFSAENQLNVDVNRFSFPDDLRGEIQRALKNKLNPKLSKKQQLALENGPKSADGAVDQDLSTGDGEFSDEV